MSDSSHIYKKILHIVAIFLTAATCRFIYVSEITQSPLYDAPVVDGRTYVFLSSQLASGNWLGEGLGPFWQPPLYPYILAVLRIFTEHFFFDSIRWLQCVLSSLTCVGIYVLGCRWYNARVGLLASVTASLYGPIIFFDGEILPASLAMSISMAGLLAFEMAQDSNRKIYFFSSGLLFGFASITVATLLSGVFALCAWTVFVKRKLLGSLLFLLGTLLIVAPVTWRNYEIGNDTVLISWNSGVNFFVGNNADYEKTLQIRAGWDWDKLVRQPGSLGIETPSDKSIYFWKSSFDYIKNQPLHYFVLQLRKTWDLFHGIEQGRNQDIYFWRNYSDLLSLLLWHYGLAFPFGLIAPLAVIGLILHFKHLNHFGGLYVLSYALAIVMFFPTARYRVVIIPLLLIFFAQAFFWLKDSLQDRNYRDSFIGLFSVIALFAFFNIGGRPMNMKGNAEIHFNLGQAYADKKIPKKALFHFQNAVQIDSTYWQAWFNSASIQGMRGNLEKAKNIFLKIATFEPNRPEVWINLAHAYRGLGQNEAAINSYEQALLVNPYLPKIYFELIQLCTQLEKLEKAEKVLNKAISIYPKDRTKILTLFSGLQRSF
ncbi:MAG: tetratricopeptide repeat protein [Candidatus Latescibacterota bacterium]|nr:tetratricopeptide repeat protein [Candidatus Latescibacterota bacterium]